VVAGVIPAVTIPRTDSASAVEGLTLFDKDTYSPITGYAGKCIDIPWSASVDGAQLQLWDCNDTNAQGWRFSAGTGVGPIYGLGKCMDVAWGSVENGAKIQLAYCNKGPAQDFVLSAAGDLVNPQSNKCVQVRDWNSDSGAALELWDCTGGANQKWSHKYPMRRLA
jgi:streptogrisin C